MVLTYTFCEIFKNTYFVKHLRITPSIYCQAIPTWRKFACNQFIAHSFDLIISKL